MTVMQVIEEQQGFQDLKETKEKEDHVDQQVFLFNKSATKSS